MRKKEKNNGVKIVCFFRACNLSAVDVACSEIISGNEIGGFMKRHRATTSYTGVNLK